MVRKHGKEKNWVKADSAKTKMRIERKKEKEHREQEMMRYRSAGESD